MPYTSLIRFLRLATFPLRELFQQQSSCCFRVLPGPRRRADSGRLLDRTLRATHRRLAWIQAKGLFGSVKHTTTSSSSGRTYNDSGSKRSCNRNAEGNRLPDGSDANLSVLYRQREYARICQSMDRGYWSIGCVDLYSDPRRGVMRHTD